MDTLAKHAEGALAYLKSLSADLGLPPEQSLWVAKEFRNGSLIYTAENLYNVEPELVEKANAATSAISSCKGKRERVPAFVSEQTIGNFAAMRAPFARDDVVRVGPVGIDNKAKWASVSYLAFDAIARMIEGKVSYVGSVIGSTYEWNKGARDPYIVVRDLATNDLVKCTYKKDDYAKVRALFDRETDTVIVYGVVIYDRILDKTEITHATDFESIQPLADTEISALFGSLPKLTGSMSSAEYVRQFREESE